MTEKTRRNFFIGSIVSVFVVATAVVVGAKGISFKQLKTSFAKASTAEYSVTFKNSNFLSADESTNPKTPVYTFVNQTTTGNDIYLVTRGGNFRNTSGIGNVTTDTTQKTLMNIRFYKDAAGTQEFKHQNILSITIKTNNTQSLQVQTCSDGFAFVEKATLDCTSSGVTYSNFNENDRFIAVAQTSQASYSRYIKEITITYECQNSIDPQFNASLTYATDVIDKHSTTSHLYFAFNSDHYGFYKFYYNGYSSDEGYYTTLFTWQFDENKGATKVTFCGSAPAGSSIEGEIASGYDEEYQGYRLFVRNTTGFYNYLTVYDNSFSVYFHTLKNNSATADTYYKYSRRSAATIVSGTVN